MNWIEEIIQLFRARIPLVLLETMDEDRILVQLQKLQNHPKWRRGDGIYRWDVADQFQVLVPGIPPFDTNQTATIDTILQIIAQFQGDGTFVLLDFHQAWNVRRTLTRKLRNLVQACQQLRNKNLIITVPPGTEIPQELDECMYRLVITRPDKQELSEIFRETLDQLLITTEFPTHLMEQIVCATLGLSATRAAQIFRQAIVRLGERPPSEEMVEFILSEKCRVIRQNPALELYPVVEENCKVGGLIELKSWLEERRCAFSPEADGYRLEKPRGVALIGIPGTGKSLCAKMIAYHWRMPLLKLEMGAVFESYLGHSEKNLREATQISERLAPCILWIDEVEKAFAGSSGDHGTATRLLGYFLTWMQERKEPVFVVVTANDIQNIPPEFLRRGRFDEVFFLDLPDSDERREIFQLHLEKRGYRMVEERFNLDFLSRVAEGFVGSEIEAAVRDAMYIAFLDRRRELTTQDIELVLKKMVPLAKSHADKIHTLRQWVLKGLARPASRRTPYLVIDSNTINDG